MSADPSPEQEVDRIQRRLDRLFRLMIVVVLVMLGCVLIALLAGGYRRI